jgi:hypothetical protein
MSLISQRLARSIVVVPTLHSRQPQFSSITSRPSGAARRRERAPTVEPAGGFMSGKHSQAKKIVTTFGAGLACAYLAPTAEGAIVSFTPSPQTVNFLNGTGFAGCGTHPVQLGTLGVINQCNDLLGKSIYAGLNIVGLRTAAVSNIVTVSQAFGSKIFRTTAATGTDTFAFRTAGASRLGWFRVNFGGPGGAVTYLDGAYNTDPRAPIHVGAVPEPVTLSLLGLAGLAAGARGLKRRRENRG